MYQNSLVVRLPRAYVVQHKSGSCIPITEMYVVPSVCQNILHSYGVSCRSILHVITC
jgi:hypothetical protein